jgi:hypothetical protein
MSVDLKVKPLPAARDHSPSAAARAASRAETPNVIAWTRVNTPAWASNSELNPSSSIAPAWTSRPDWRTEEAPGLWNTVGRMRPLSVVVF